MSVAKLSNNSNAPIVQQGVAKLREISRSRHYVFQNGTCARHEVVHPTCAKSARLYCHGRCHDAN
jgi:hypothetical protein